MEYQIKELEKADLDRHIKTYIKTLNNLSNTPSVTSKEANKIFEEIKNQGTVIYIALNEMDGIIGSISLLLEKKFIRGGGTAGHIEDVVVRKGFEGYGIGSKLIKATIKKAKEIGCYKIILDCDQNLEKYYNKFGFQTNGAFMRKYL